MQLLGYTLESPNLKRSSHAQFFDILKKTHIFTRRNVLAVFHDAIFRHACIEINKHLNLNVLQYAILCLQSILSVYLIIITNIQISTLNHSLEIRSHIQVYTVQR